MIVVLALAAVLSALSGGYLCAPRPAPRLERRSAPVVELATRPDRWDAVALHLRRGVSVLGNGGGRISRTARARRPSPIGAPPPVAPSPSREAVPTVVVPPTGLSTLQVDRPVGDPWLTVAPVLPSDARAEGRVLRRGPYGAPPVPGGRITLDDDVDLDLRFRSVAMASSVVATGDHLDHVQITGHDGRIHVLAEERGRVAFGVLSVGD